MHSSRSLEPMRTRQKFREGAAPISKKLLQVEQQEEDHDQEIMDLAPYWDELVETGEENA
jgi:hypothetical protein